MFTIILLSFSGLTLALLAILVLYSNFKSPVNRWLGSVALGGLAWLLANLLASIFADSAQLNLLFTRAAILGSSFVPFAFLMFCFAFIGKPLNRRIKLVWFIPVLVIFAIAPTSLNIRSVDIQTGNFEAGPAYGLALAVSSYFIYGAYLLAQDYRRATAVKRRQLTYILAGVVLTIVPAAVLNAILPIFGLTQAAAIGPVVVLIFTTLTSIAIVRHGLFNIRLVVARAIGYGGSLAILASIYGLLVFGVAKFVFGIEISFGAQALLSGATGVAALTFGPIKKWFNTITNRLFYRDAYDPQELFDRLNQVLLSSLDIRYLLGHSATIIQGSLKSEGCQIGLFGDQQYRSFGESKNRLSDADIVNIRRMTHASRKHAIVTDQLDVGQYELQTVLNERGIAVLVPLSQITRKSNALLGYVVLGVKKSGNAYSQQDIRTLENIAKELVIAIQNALHFEEIQNFNATLQAKVDEATRKLRRTNEKLRALDEAKDDFVSMASHQLRTPLTSIKGYTSMVLEGDAGTINDTQRKLLEQSFFSSQRMVYLIADLLNVSRLKTGKFIIEPAPVNLAEVVQQEIGQLKDVAAGRSLTLNYDMPEAFPELLLDETKTRQVIMNFIDNAIYYTPAGGNITVELRETPASVELRVVDDGIGVPKSERPHLFTKFYRAGNARKARPDGTGLGLFMAKKVIVAEGGAVIFETEEGKGSIFGFMFPKTKLATPVEPPKQAVANAKT